MKTNILKSDYADFFVEFESIEIFILDSSESELIWNEYIKSSGKSYSSIENENWLVASDFKVIGDWITDFNNSEISQISNLLGSECVWKDSDTIAFIISKYEIIETEWKNFKSNWINFLYCDDDCPIVINLTNFDSAFYFTPLGKIIKVRRDV